MNRIVILGRGGSGKSVLAKQLAAATGIRAVELDDLFWHPALVATPRGEWISLQQGLVQSPQWILDGDLGPYDVLEPRLRRADTVIVLDFSPLRAAWQSLRRSSERLDYWCWLLTWRRRSRPVILQAIADHAPSAALHVLRSPTAVRRFLAEVNPPSS